MIEPQFTVLMPTFDHEAMIVHAIRSVQAQTFTDFRLIVVGDGAPETTARLVGEIATADPRIAYRAFPKGARTGEEHRHVLLGEIESPWIAYLSDDDVWFPDHLQALVPLLETHDLVNTRPLALTRQLGTSIRAGTFARWRQRHQTGLTQNQLIYEFRASPQKLQIPADRAQMFEEPPRSIIALSHVAHRLAAYRRLPQGWAPAPQGCPTDINMWRKFLRDPACTVQSGTTMTTLSLESWQRRDMDNAKRESELSFWAAMVERSDFRAALRARMANMSVVNAFHLLDAIMDTWTSPPQV
jgi:glycosyltransferase involved in cell wall biosynthesis